MGYPIGEARRQLPALIKRALQGREEIHLGDRGSDAVTLVATTLYEQTKALAQQTLTRENRQPQATARPFAALEVALRRSGVAATRSQSALREGMPPLYRRARRYIADFQAESRIDEQAQAALGTRTFTPDAAQPHPPVAHRRRRTAGQRTP
jgi:hypothetical protein